MNTHARASCCCYCGVAALVYEKTEETGKMGGEMKYCGVEKTEIQKKCTRVESKEKLQRSSK